MKRCPQCGHEHKPEPDEEVEFGVVRPFPVVRLPADPSELVVPPREYSTIIQQPEPQTITT